MTLTSPSDLGATRHLVVSQRLRERRRTLGRTQKQVISRLARLGVLSTNRALSSLEHGSGLDVAKLPELAIALDCTVTYLIGLTDDPHSWQPDPPSELPPSRPAESVAGTRSPITEPADECTRSLLLGDFIPQDRPGSRLRR